MSDRRADLSASLADVRERAAQAARAAGRDLQDITLIAVTKTYPVSDVKILADLGIADFGENRSEEGLEKSLLVPSTWHYQGQVQSRKLRDIATWADVIHSLDQLSHIEKLARICLDMDKTLKIFIQLSLDGAPDRGGVLEEGVSQLAQSVENSEKLQLVGLMCVPPVEYEFEEAFTQIAEVGQRFRSNYPQAILLSAGMSSDFEEAIAHGATHIRVGSQILGSRPKNP